VSFALSIEPIARSLLGDPNPSLSSKTEWRYGNRGSLCIDLKQDTWFDHEANVGGGVLDLITRLTGFDATERSRWLHEHGYEDEQRPKKRRGVPVAHYNYRDEWGELLFQVVRFEPKDFRQRRPDKTQPDGWTWSVKGVRSVPYALPDLDFDHTLFICEGEKDCDRLWSIGIQATCNAGGVGKWRPELTDCLRQAIEVIVIPDRDPQKRDPKTNEALFHEDGRPILPGQDHAQDVAASLAAAGVKVRVLELWKHWHEMPLKADVSDWLAMAANREDPARELYALAEEAPDWSPQQHVNGHDKSPLPDLRLLTPFPIVERELPRREWIIPGLLIRKHVTVMVAPSGAGKSLLTLQIGMACAQGIRWAGWAPRKNGDRKGYRVLFVNAEDDYDEIRRRLAAAMRHMPCDGEILRQNFFVAEADRPVIAKFDPKTRTIVPDQKFFPLLVEQIKQSQIDIVFVDPFAETFEGDENSNSDLKWAGAQWREVARQTGAAVCLVHHAKKYAQQMAGDVDAARGASALIGVARIVSTLFPMTEKESELLLTEQQRNDRSLYLRYDDAKANLNLTTVVARWFKKRDIKLDNADEDGQDADQVGTLVSEQLQRSSENFLEVDIIRFLKSVDRGMLDKDGNSTGEYYTFETRKAKEHELSRYVGDFAKEFFKFPSLNQAAQYINKLVDKKRLRDGPKYKSKRSRHERTRCVSEFYEEDGKTSQATQPEATLL
jgi:hypothetical protein